MFYNILNNLTKINIKQGYIYDSNVSEFMKKLEVAIKA